MPRAEPLPEGLTVGQADRTAAYRPVTDPQEIRLTLTEVMVRERPVRLSLGPISLSPAEGLRLRVHADGLTLSSPEPANPPGPDALEGAVLRTELHGAQLRFHAQHARVTVHEGLRTIHLAWPDRLLRLQEREAFRIRPPAPAHALCVLRPGVGRERVHRVLDVSAGGLALAWPVSLPRPLLDQLWPHCRLEIPALAPIPCDLRVRAIHEPDEAEPEALRVGVVFDRPTPETQRATQRYVFETERAALRTRPGS
jgi:hypothetical protein